MNLDSLNIIVPLIVIGSFVLVLGIMALFFAPFLLRLMRQSSTNKALIQAGKTAPASLINMQQTGAEISSGGFQNFEVVMQLQVQPADDEPFVATATQFIPLLQLQQMQPGTTILVRYNPANKSQVAVANNLGNLANSVQADGMDAAAAQQLVLNNEILESEMEQRGVAAPAQIVAAEKLGVRLYNGTAEMVRLTFDIQPTQGMPFRSQANSAIVQASLKKYQAGAKVTVKYDPADTRRVVLVGSR